MYFAVSVPELAATQRADRMDAELAVKALVGQGSAGVARYVRVDTVG